LKVTGFRSLVLLVRCRIEIKTSKEHWWNYTDRGKPKYWGGKENLSQCQIVHHKSRVKWHGMEPLLHGEKPAIEVTDSGALNG
jgi:hypothetical protein